MATICLILMGMLIEPLPGQPDTWPWPCQRDPASAGTVGAFGRPRLCRPVGRLLIYVLQKVFGSLNVPQNGKCLTGSVGQKLRSREDEDAAAADDWLGGLERAPCSLASFAELPLRAALSATKNLGQTTLEQLAIPRRRGAALLMGPNFSVAEMPKTLDHIRHWLFNESRCVWASSDLFWVSFRSFQHHLLMFSPRHFSKQAPEAQKQAVIVPRDFLVSVLKMFDR